VATRDIFLDLFVVWLYYDKLTTISCLAYIAKTKTMAEILGNHTGVPQITWACCFPFLSTTGQLHPS
jgi:hypothetical protein